MRQELDLRRLALGKGFRVAGVASDLNVSATKVPPWKRKQLGAWLHDRAPEFDVILFWKMDRFVRRVSDLNVMIDWCTRFGKNLVSKHDPIDLTSATGRLVTTLVGSFAEIESTGTSTRVASLWNYAKAQRTWPVGKPSYGYMTAKGEHGGTKLIIDPDAHKALLWCRKAALRKGGGVSARYMVKILVRARLCGPGLTTTTLLRRLRNPALMGYRVEEDKNSGSRRRAKLVIDHDGKPIRVGEPIFSEAEFESLQAAINRRTHGSRVQRRPGEASPFIKVLVCATCLTSMTVQRTITKGRAYEYLRCQKCPSGGLGAPNPQRVYDELVQAVCSILGDFPVQTCEYSSNPDGREGTPSTRGWVYVQTGMNFRERWTQSDVETVAKDLRRIGVRCEVTRTKVPRTRAPRVRLSVILPKDVEASLVIKKDEFADFA